MTRLPLESVTPTRSMTGYGRAFWALSHFTPNNIAKRERSKVLTGRMESVPVANSMRKKTKKRILFGDIQMTKRPWMHAEKTITSFHKEEDLKQ